MAFMVPLSQKLKWLSNRKYKYFEDKDETFFHTEKRKLLLSSMICPID
jgi:hypothetical protein